MLCATCDIMQTPTVQVNDKKLIWSRQPTQAPGINIEASQLELPEPGLGCIGPERASPAVASWLAAIGGLKTALGNLPAEMTASKGRLMLDVVSLLAGKPVFDKVRTQIQLRPAWPASLLKGGFLS